LYVLVEECLIQVYHIGNEHLVELHVVLDEDLCLREVHDIVQPLEHKLEALPFVEKAFIHCDYFCDGI
jgi:divalent metal cation (Fe/Co/Zn/Cd) transporter